MLSSTPLRSLARVTLLLAAVSTSVACGQGGSTELGLDAGPRDAESLVQPGNNDSGPIIEDTDACAILVQRTCGPSATECSESASCAAALLLQTYEASRCEQALASPGTYEECTDDACTTLMVKTCGAAPEPLTECAAEPACTLTNDLFDASKDQSGSADDREDALNACAAGLEDGIVFAACPSS
jgi:hypothetical protein